MKNRPYLFATVLCFALAMPALAAAQAPGHPFGLGLQLGDPGFAFSAKYFFDSNDAIQGTIGWRSGWYYGAPGPIVTLDWQHRVGTVGPHSGKVRVSFNVGVGGAAGYMSGYHCVNVPGRPDQCYQDEAEVALRLPLNVSVYWPIPRLEAYAEVAPMLMVGVPYFGPGVMGGVGGRFWF